MSHQPVQVSLVPGQFYVRCTRCGVGTVMFHDNDNAWHAWESGTAKTLPCVGDPVPANMVAIESYDARVEQVRADAFGDAMERVPLRDMNAEPIISTVEKYRRAITAKAIALDECRERLRDCVMIGNPDMITAECKAWLRAVDELDHARAVFWEHCNDR